MAGQEHEASVKIVLDPTKAAFTTDTRVEDLGNTHFIGIGGAGMSVLAEMLHQLGVAVDGSDREANTKTERLESLGIPVELGQRAENVSAADTVVYSSAIKPDNPEILAAADKGAKIVHRSDILALLMNNKRAVSVAGAHGKTTTSSLLAHILTHGGTGQLADPSYAIGGSIQGEDGTVIDGGHSGTGDVLVAEADESDGSFGKYTPQIAIITNAEADHLDHYHTEENYRKAFTNYASHAKGNIVVCVDDEGALAVVRAMDPQTAAKTIAYTTRTPEELGDLNGVSLALIESETESSGTGVEQFTLVVPETVTGQETRVPVELSIPGEHNARNAAAAILSAGLLGMPLEKAAAAATSFRGAARRFDVRGEVNGVTVVDDYAHHPTEIDALLRAARRKYPESTIRVLFQPHLFSRTQFFANQFAEALSLADDVVVTGIYPAREKQEDFPAVGAQTIVDEARSLPSNRKDDWIHAVEDMELAAQMMAMRAQPDDVIFTVGAGDITAMGPVMLHILRAHFEGQTD